jgi:cytochrome c oxidase subunit 2
MFRAVIPWILAILVGVSSFLSASESVTTTSSVDVDGLVAEFNPDPFAIEGQDATRPVNRITNTFTSPGSDIAEDVRLNTWVMIGIYLPFLVLPQLLLVYIIWRFRDRKDQRKAATFTHHTALEVVWTAIPCLAIIAVGIPVYNLLWKMELPPKDIDNALKIEIIGKSFAWDYVYKDYKAHDQKTDLTMGQDVAGIQEPLVLEVGRAAVLDITSKDVNHAWWVPAFGVKKDAIIGRYTNAWFTPTKPGFYKGNCAELCGQGHGIMLITVVVAAKERFDQFVSLLRHRDDVGKVWNLLSPAAATVDSAVLRSSIAAFLKDHDGENRRLALRFWIANNAVSAARMPIKQLGRTAAEWNSLAVQRRAMVDAILGEIPLTSTPIVH